MPRKKPSPPLPTPAPRAAVRIDTSVEYGQYLLSAVSTSKVAIIGALGALFVLYSRDIVTPSTLTLVVALSVVVFAAIYTLRYQRQIQGSFFEFSDDGFLWHRKHSQDQYLFTDIDEVRRPNPEKNPTGFDYRDIRFKNGKRIFLYAGIPNYELLAEQIDKYHP